MAFHKIDDISINGKNTAFGGYIHEAKLDVGLADKPTEVVLSFVSRSGDFQEPPLSLTQSYSISFGNIFSDNFYAIEFLTNGKTMDVTFIDGSSILDRIYVLLRHRMVPPSLGATAGIIVIGKEMHPCDENEDGKFDAKDALELELTEDDPCQIRCPNAYNDEQSVITACLQKEAKEILEVKYSFSDLLDAMAGTTPKAISGKRKFDIIDSSGKPTSVTLPSLTNLAATHAASRVSVAKVPASFNKGYLTTYTGTLRSVLSNWCSDFGWSYFWEKGQLHFIDTRNRPKINFSEFNNLASKTVSKSLRNTVARGTYSHYSESGVESSVECSTPRAHLLRCLTLKDLFGDFYKPLPSALTITQSDLPITAPGSALDVVGRGVTVEKDATAKFFDDVYPNGIPLNLFEPSVVCAYYGQRMREAFNWLFIYNIKTVQNATDLIGKRMERIGGLVFRKVFSYNVNETFYNLAMIQSDSAGSGNKPLFPQPVMNAAEKKEFESRNGYLIIAERTSPAGTITLVSEELSNQFMTEQSLARDFLGKHWVKTYRAPHYGGGAAPQVVPNTEYLASDALITNNLAFSQFKHTRNSYVDKLCYSAAQIDRNEYGGGLDAAKQRVSKVSRSKLTRSILYHEKNAVWHDADLTNSTIATQLAEFSKIAFFEIPVDVAVLRRAFPDPNPVAGAADNRQLVLIGAYAQEAASTTLTHATTKNETDDNMSYNQVVGDMASASYGLRGKATISYTLKCLSTSFVLKMPAASSYLLDDHPNFSWDRQGAIYSPALGDPPQAANAPRFKVYVSTSSSAGLFIPKMESVNLTLAPADSGKLPNAMKVEYIGNELQRLTLRRLNRLNKNTCIIPDDVLKEAHENAVNNMGFSMVEKSESRRYQIFGLSLSNPLKIKDGLESLSVSVSSRGVFTDIVLGNSLFTPISSDYATFQIESKINHAVSNSRPSVI